MTYFAQSSQENAEPATVARPGSRLRRFLLPLILVLAFVLATRGITVSMMHPDQMAFQPLFKPDLAPFNPGWFEKPPFHTYFNYFLSVWPISTIAAELGIASEDAQRIQELWSKILTALLFAGSVLVFHSIVRRFTEERAALAAAALFATSAGLVAHAHFLTADIPVMFWMLVSFSFCQRILWAPTARNYAFAGLFAGVATACKYNGLGVAAALLAAHLCHVFYLRGEPLSLRRLVNLQIILGSAAVAIGFVAANPYSVFDYRTFLSDFWYNYTVAPVYEGQTGSSYLRFFISMTNLVGLPGFVLFSLATLLALARTLRSRDHPIRNATVWIATAVLVLYYAKFAPFPRLEDRFVLPAIPYLLLIGAAAFPGPSKLAGLGLFGLLAYNTAAAVEVGNRFMSDPRLEAMAWTQANAPIGSTVELDVYASAPPRRPDIHEVRMPFVTGRERLFLKLFPNNRFISGSPKYHAESDRLVTWFSADQLEKRAPDVIIVNSLYYDRFLLPGPRRDLYPTMERYFTDLLAERLPYRIVFDRRSPEVPWWSYPQKIDFLQKRVTVLARKAKAD